MHTPLQAPSQPLTQPQVARLLASAYEEPAVNERSAPSTWQNVCKSEHFSTEIAPGITLHILPGVQISWEEFLATAPAYSIAGDGFVRGASKRDTSKLIANLNHHEDVDRLSTLSTAGQAHMGAQTGAFTLFRREGAPYMHIWLSDCDQDCATLVYILTNLERLAPGRSEPLLNKLVYIQDKLDVTSGTYPLDVNSALARQMAWIFQPYVSARTENRIAEMTGAAMADVISAICARINDYSLGKGRQIPLDVRWELLGKYDGWSMVKPVGFYANSQLNRMGFTAVAAYGGELPGGRHKWSFYKLSDADPFPLEKFWSYLNQVEGIPNGGALWGGGNSTGGSPRPHGSSLGPKEFAQVTDTFLDMHRRGEI